MGEAAIKDLAREQQKELRTMARGIAGRDVADAQNPALPSAGRGKRAECPRAGGHSRGTVTRKSTILVSPRPTLLF